MKTPFRKVTSFIERHAMLKGTRGVLVAVSGGPDSIVLLDMLAQLTAGLRGSRAEAGTSRDSKREIATPIPLLHVAHLDHKLRGRESTEDADFVCALADRLSLGITISSVDVQAAAEACGRGIEEVAREIRYDFLLTAAREAGCDRIAVGHTMTDQAETFLMRLIRGTGLRGLAAMRPIIAAHVFSGERAEEKGRRGEGEKGSKGAGAQGSKGMAEERTRGAEAQTGSSAPLLPFSPSPLFPFSVSPLLIRPLLCITREEVEAYCEQMGREFRTDRTNRSLHYTRNRVRSDIFPALRTLNPRVVESMARAAENIAGDQDALDQLALALLSEARLAPDAWRQGAGIGMAYSVSAILEQPVGLRRRMIIEAIRLFGELTGSQREGNGSAEIGSKHVSSVEGLLRTNASGKHITLPGGLLAWREFDVLVFSAASASTRDLEYESIISASQPEAEAGGFAFLLRRSQNLEMLTAAVEETQVEALRSGRDWMTVALDDEAIPESLVIRPRRPGERAHVVGQRKTKKLKNLMIDHRIPTSRRANWPLVTTLDGCYIWSPGLPPALKFAAHDDTHRVAIMRALAI